VLAVLNHSRTSAVFVAGVVDLAKRKDLLPISVLWSSSPL